MDNDDLLNICNGYEEDCVSEGEKNCWLSPDCHGIMFNAGWSLDNRGVKVCTSSKLREKSEKDWSVFLKCSQMSLVTSEYMDLSGNKDGMLYLPWEFKEHCIAKMNPSRAQHIIIGGNKYPKSTVIVASNNEMTSGPDLAGNGRYQHACVHIKHFNGSNYVIAAGGHDNAALQTSEILDVNNLDKSNSWSSGT